MWRAGRAGPRAALVPGLGPGPTGRAHPPRRRRARHRPAHPSGGRGPAAAAAGLCSAHAGPGPAGSAGGGPGPPLRLPAQGLHPPCPPLHPPAPPPLPPPLACGQCWQEAGEAVRGGIAGWGGQQAARRCGRYLSDRLRCRRGPRAVAASEAGTGRGAPVRPEHVATGRRATCSWRSGRISAAGGAPGGCAVTGAGVLLGVRREGGGGEKGGCACTHARAPSPCRRADAAPRTARPAPLRLRRGWTLSGPAVPSDPGGPRLPGASGA